VSEHTVTGAVSQSCNQTG